MASRPLLLLLGLALVALAPSAPQPPVIIPAYPVADGLVEFDVPVALAWDSLVPGPLRRETLEADPARRRQLYADRNMFGGTEVSYPLPLPPELLSRRYYLLDSAGVAEVRPTGIRGAVYIDWQEPGGEIQAIQAFGQVQAAARLPGRPALALVTGEPVTLEVSASTLSSDALLAPGGDAYPHRGTPFWHIRRQYHLRQTSPVERSWIWVQWAPDSTMVEVGCEHRLSLFALTPAPALIASLSAGCDV